MKNNPILIRQVTWLMAATGMFVLGRWSAKTESMGALAAPPTAASSVPDHLGAINKAETEVATAENPQAWVEAYRGTDSKIDSKEISLAVLDALRDTDQARSMMKYSQLLKELTPENAAAAFKTVRESVTGWEAMRYLPLLNYTWGSIDGEKALAAMQTLPGDQAWFATDSALSGYASENPEAAKKWLDAKKDQEKGQGNESWGHDNAYVSGLARKDIGAAIRYVESLPQEQRGDYVEILFEQQIKNGITASADWALSLNDPSMKANALDLVARQYAQQDMGKAANWVKTYAGESFGKNAIAAVAREYATRAPAEALKWAATLPGGESQNEAYARVFREWGRSDPTSASERLVVLPAGASKDDAISSFTRSIARENPEDAIAWVNTIGNSGTREAAQIAVVQRWRSINAEAANQWAEENLSPEALTKASERPQREGGWGEEWGR